MTLSIPPSESSASPPVAAGVNTSAPVAAPATPATAGGKTTGKGRKANAGAETSHPSEPTQSTKNGKQPAPPSAPTEAADLPYALAISAAFLYQQQAAAEIVAVLDSPLHLTTSTHDLDLDPGNYLIVRWPTGLNSYDVQAIERPAMSADISEATP